MVNGEPVKIVKKKRYFAKFGDRYHANWSTSTAGTYILTRTDNTLTIGSSTFYPSDFKDGVIPCEIIVVVVGPGGGGEVPSITREKLINKLYEKLEEYIKKHFN